ncbi:aldo/keto reductase [Methylobacterium sp. P1-11]|uniref:aldo/keto reductase n=1 Tax=Methylobacterium sp. P1-11 TaxID=2024616 RepID=UPI001FEF9AC9|nr:aldo/keto reductase [Methylobacterium sp. P1-11]
MPFIEENFAVVETLRAVAGELGRQMARVALAWVARRSGVASVLVRASRPEQLEQNIAAQAARPVGRGSRTAEAQSVLHVRAADRIDLRRSAGPGVVSDTVQAPGSMLAAVTVLCTVHSSSLTTNARHVWPPVRRNTAKVFWPSVSVLPKIGPPQPRAAPHRRVGQGTDLGSAATPPRGPPRRRRGLRRLQ